MKQPKPAYYSSNDVSAATGATLRQVQWACERGFAKPVKKGARRLWPPDEVLRFALYVELSRKHVARRLIRWITRKVQLSNLPSGPLYLVTTPHGETEILRSDSEVVYKLVNSYLPLIVVDLGSIFRLLFGRS